MKPVTFVALAAVALAACTGEAPAPVWEGNSGHVDLHGDLAGQPFDLRVEGNAAIDPAVVSCRLAYTGARLTSIDVLVHAEGRDLDLRFAGADLAALRQGELLDVAPGAVAIAMTPGGEARSGRFVFGQLIGPQRDAVIPSGRGQFGGAFEVDLADGGHLSGSVTARCAQTVVTP